MQPDMITSNRAVAGAVALFIAYWMIFFGRELVQTILLLSYSVSDSSYNALSHDSLKNSELSYVTKQASQEIHLEQNMQVIHTKNVTQVPLIIHRMWKDHTIPKPWRDAYNICEEAYKQKNWTTILWTDASIRSLLVQHFEHFLQTYNSYPYDIQRVDSARYFILYHYGGVYLDLDVGCRNNKDIAELIRAMEYMNVDSMFPITEPFGMSNDVMFASKENQLFKRITETLPVKNRWFGLPYLTVLFSTGPMFLSLICMNYPHAKEEILALSSDLYSKTDARFFHHLRGSTWHSVDANTFKWLIRHWLFVVMSLVIVLMLFTFSRARIQQERQWKVFKPHRLSM